MSFVNLRTLLVTLFIMQQAATNLQSSVRSIKWKWQLLCCCCCCCCFVSRTFPEQPMTIYHMKNQNNATKFTTQGNCTIETVLNFMKRFLEANIQSGVDYYIASQQPHGLISCVSICFMSKNKSDISKILTKYTCDLQVFSLNGIKPICGNYRKILSRDNDENLKDYFLIT